MKCQFMLSGNCRTNLVSFVVGYHKRFQFARLRIFTARRTAHSSDAVRVYKCVNER